MSMITTGTATLFVTRITCTLFIEMRPNFDIRQIIYHTTTLVFNSKSKSIVKMVEKCNFCLSVQSVFQQAEVQCSGYNYWHTSLMMLKFCEHLDHEIQNNFGIQHTAQKCKETQIKIQTSFCSDRFNCKQTITTIHQVLSQGLSD